MPLHSRAAVLGVFGQGAADSTKPTIQSISPADGTTITSDESVLITATITDDSNFIGVNWTWLEGLPAELPDGYRRCTNDVCDDSYGAWKPQSEPYDFLTLKKPPPGQYKFKVEAMDAYGNYVSDVINVTVVQGEGGDTGEATSEGTGETGGEGETDSPTTAPEASGDVPTEGHSSDPTSVTSITSAGEESSGEGTAGGSEDGGCRLAGSPGPAWLLLLLGLGARRRRR